MKIFCSLMVLYLTFLLGLNPVFANDDTNYINDLERIQYEEQFMLDFCILKCIYRHIIDQ